MRLIDAEAFKAYMRGALEQTRRCYPDGGEWAEAVTEEFCRDIDEQPTAQPEQRWIPSGERPPEEGSYLVWMPFAPPEERIAVEYYCDGYWNIKTPISAWMPLPEPYRGGEE